MSSVAKPWMSTGTAFSQTTNSSLMVIERTAEDYR
jgi:hypothetical protein